MTESIWRGDFTPNEYGIFCAHDLVRRGSRDAGFAAVLDRPDSEPVSVRRHPGLHLPAAGGSSGTPSAARTGGRHRSAVPAACSGHPGLDHPAHGGETVCVFSPATAGVPGLGAQCDPALDCEESRCRDSSGPGTREENAVRKPAHRQRRAQEAAARNLHRGRGTGGILYRRAAGAG